MVRFFLRNPLAAASTATMPGKRRSLRYRARRLAVSLVTIYTLVCLVGCALQTRLIFPGAATQGTPDAVIEPPLGCRLLHLTTSTGTPIVALFGKARLPTGAEDPRSATLPTVIYFYGNGMCLADSLAEFDLFRRLGANCIAVEYEGYGMAGGSPSEKGCYASAEAAYQYLLTRSDIDTHKLIAAGWSLGAAVAIDLSARHVADHRIVAIVGLSAFTSMVDVAQYHYPMLPVSLFLQHRFLSEQKLRTLPKDLPIFLGHGRADDIVPFSQSDRLAAAAQGPVTRYISPTAAHNDFLDIAEPELAPALAEFLHQF